MARQVRELPKPERLRVLERPFAWIPCRLLTSGTLAAMSPDARQLYLFLALAADRNGLSFYGDDHIAKTLGFSHDALRAARTQLIDLDLLACGGRDHQLLSLRQSHRYDTRPSSSSKRATDSIHSRQQRPHAPPQEAEIKSKMPQDVRQALRQIFGDDAF